MPLACFSPGLDSVVLLRSGTQIVGDNELRNVLPFGEAECDAAQCVSLSHSHRNLVLVHGRRPTLRPTVGKLGKAASTASLSLELQASAISVSTLLMAHAPPGTMNGTGCV